MSNDHFVGIPSIHLLKTYENKKYTNIYAALEEYIDNSLDAIERGFSKETEQETLPTITFSLEEDSVIVADNSTGMDEEQLKTALRLGDSGTGKSGIENSLGVFGCGASSAALTIGKSLVFLTKTETSDLLYGAVDPEYILSQGAWVYPLRPATEPERADFAKFTGEESTSGTVAIVRGLTEPPKKKSSFYDTLKKKILTRYSHRFLGLQNSEREVYFNFIGGDSRNFKATDRVVDVLCDEDQTKTSFFKNFGGPNNEVVQTSVLGCEVGVRASFTKDYDTHLEKKHNKSKTENYWGYGINANQKQGIYFYRNGKLLETRSGNPIWKYHGALRGLLVEIHITDEMIDNKLAQIAQEKTSVVLSEKLTEKLEQLFQPIVAMVRSIRSSESNSKVELTDEQEKQKAENTVEGISKALKSQRKKPQSAEKLSPLKGIIEQVTARENKNYVGSGDKVEASTSKKKQSEFDYRWVNELRSKTTPFWIEYLNPESDDGILSTAKTIILNEAHPLMKELKEASMTHIAIIFAVSTAYGMDKDSDFCTEEFELTAQGIGEIALKIIDSVKQVEQKQEERLKVSA